MNNCGARALPSTPTIKGNVMTFQDDPNRPRPPFDDPLVTRDAPAGEAPSAGMGWGIPLALAAFALIAGLFFFNMSSDRTAMVARTDEPSSVVRPAPAPNVTPPPAMPPAKTQ
jgi:hypothetical protein